jgi:hypothetical protein
MRESEGAHRLEQYVPGVVSMRDTVDMLRWHNTSFALVNTLQFSFTACLFVSTN